MNEGHPTFVQGHTARMALACQYIQAARIHKLKDNYLKMRRQIYQIIKKTIAASTSKIPRVTLPSQLRLFYIIILELTYVVVIVVIC
jgi:hypothetical protein